VPTYRLRFVGVSHRLPQRDVRFRAVTFRKEARVTESIRRGAEMSDEQLDKERRRGWRLSVWVTPEDAALLTDRFFSEHEVGEISPEAWARLAPKTKEEQ